MVSVNMTTMVTDLGVMLEEDLEGVVDLDIYHPRQIQG